MSDFPLDPFTDQIPLPEDHPVIQYLDWQCQSHRKYLDVLCNNWLDSSFKSFKEHISEFDLDYGVPDSTLDHFEYPLKEIRRVSTRMAKLRREKLRLIGAVDFDGSNYLLRG